MIFNKVKSMSDVCNFLSVKSCSLFSIMLCLDNFFKETKWTEKIIFEQRSFEIHKNCSKGVKFSLVYTNTTFSEPFCTIVLVLE